MVLNGVPYAVRHGHQGVQLPVSVALQFNDASALTIVESRVKVNQVEEDD